ncbi:DUF4232 domain-containing protein [Planotetraspora sp. A-T 1434]|uniref:DUF4232 domain-containing protein n=1 Tax=Planotetraspora sp. A-T 1434 TaxID=2979219 RepID=UPI0021C01BE9|nr:DUF4232 domain-containing protein [Planotetraspora sp. A-T 1434]MCT9932286.1 DUF4232 domain-containing protein [Planotetraspora sp. A-T 1434]
MTNQQGFHSGRHDQEVVGGQAGDGEAAGGRAERREREEVRRQGRPARSAAGMSAVLAGGAVLLSVLTGCADGGGTGAAAPPESASPGSANQASGGHTSGGEASGGQTNSPAAPATSPTTGGGGAPAVTRTPAPTGGGTQPSGAPGGRCQTSDLRASVGPNHPGAGQENFAIVLTNKSGRTCTVYGFPGAAFVNATGQAVTVNPERLTGVEKRRVPVAPGHSAWAALTYTNPQVTGVTTVTPAALLITPPDETAPLRVRWTGGPVSNTGKASVPRVGPFQAGDGA